MHGEKTPETMLGIKSVLGKNAILKGLNLEDGATARGEKQPNPEATKA